MMFYQTKKNQTVYSNILGIIQLILLSCIFVSANLAAMPAPKASGGELNLTHWKFSADGTVRLEGDWQFYWKQFVLPNSTGDINDDSIGVPGSWNGHQLKDNGIVTGHGYASYRLNVLLPEETSKLALKIIDIGEAFRLYVNGRLLHSGGEIGTNSDQSQPAFARSVILLPTDIGKKLNIVIHVSNYHYHSGGLWEHISLGEVGAIQSLHELSLGYAMFLAGSIGIIAFYHIGLYTQRRQDSSPLYFAIFCIAMAIRILTVDERYLNQLIPSISYSMLIKIEYLSFLLAIPALAVFITNLLPGSYPRWMPRLTIILGFIFSGVVMLTPVSVFSDLLRLFQVYLVTSLCFGVYVFIRSVKEHRQVAKGFLFGFLVLAAASLNDILISLGIFRTPVFLVGAGILSFILIQSYSFSLRFTRAFTKVETLSRELEDYANTLESKVKQRTKELELVNRKLEQQVSIDGLTGIANRRGFDTLLNHAWAGHSRRVAYLGLVMCDIDFFKTYNDTYGHLKGDEVLTKVAQCIEETLHREADTAARYGGEEFAILLPDTHLEGAVIMANKINNAIRGLNIFHEKSLVSNQLTISCGAAAIIPTDRTKPKDLIALADSALYDAKKAGRDKTIAAG